MKKVCISNPGYPVHGYGHCRRLYANTNDNGRDHDRRNHNQGYDSEWYNWHNQRIRPQVTAPGELPVTTEQVTLTMGIQQNVRVADYEDNFMTKMVWMNAALSLISCSFPPTNRYRKSS